MSGTIPRASSASLFRPARGCDATDSPASRATPAPARTQRETADDGLTLYLDEIARTPLLDAAAEVALARRIEAGDAAALRELARANLRLVVSIAKRYAGQGVDLLDLVQEGNLGLLRAAARFDWRRGIRFATYASWWIRQGITKALTAQSRAIRLPGRMSETVRRVKRAAADLAQALGRAPSLDEIAGALDMRPARVAFVLQVAQPAVSLDTPLTDSDDDLGGVLAGVAEPDPEERVAEHLLHQDLEHALLDLPERQYAVLALRFGLDGAAPHTLAAVGARLGLSRERARQIERQALRTLHQRLEGDDAPAHPPMSAGDDIGPATTAMAAG